MASPGAGRFTAALADAIEVLPRGLRTRFAPAPTGFLHLGHVANAVVTWGVARATGGQIVLRIEDHDRQRCRPEFEVAILTDLETLGFLPDEPPLDTLRSGRPSDHRQSDRGDAYAAAVAKLENMGLVYACDCSRSTFTAWATTLARPWAGPGCPGGCATRRLPRDAGGVAWRVALSGGIESWTDLAVGPESGPVGGQGDPSVRDRKGNWTYALCVVVDDIRHGIDLVVRGEDLLHATPMQIRLARLLGRATPPRFLHHPLICQADGRKLSKADGATGVRELLAAGSNPAGLRSLAATVIGATDVRA